MRKTVILSALILLIFLSFLGSLSNDFVHYDDDGYITANQIVKGGLSLRGLRWALTNLSNGNWQPVTWLSHMLDVELFGLEPAGHHAVSLLWHAAGSAVLFLVFDQMTGALWPSAFVAAFFAVHPLRVESVAWAAERKDVLCAFFWLLSLAAYLRYVGHRRRGAYSLLIAGYCLSLMAKPMSVTLPATLLILDYWPLGRFRNTGSKHNWAPLFREKAPLLILAFGIGLLTIVSQHAAGAMFPQSSVPLWARLGNALRAYFLYVRKTFIPHDLTVLYPHPGSSLDGSDIMAGATLIIGLTILALLAHRRYPFIAAGWAWFVLTLLPVIGVIQVGDQALADRYSYIPHVGFLTTVVWAAFEISKRLNGRILPAVAMAGLALSTAATMRQVTYWRDTTSLMERELALFPGNAAARNALGSNLLAQGKTDQAIAAYRLALEARPNISDYHFNLALALAKKGSYEDAEAHYRQAINLRPRDYEARFQLADLLIRRKRLPEAEEHLRRLIRADAGNYSARLALAKAVLLQGRKEEAIRQFETARLLRPDDPAALVAQGVIAAEEGDTAAADDLFQKALLKDPDNVEAMYNLGKLMDGGGDVEAAIVWYRKALARDAESADIHNNLGAALATMGAVSEAAEHFRRALRLDPNHREARINLERIQQP